MASHPRAVLYVVHALPPAEHTGTPLVVRGYAQALGEAGWHVTVLTAGLGAPAWSLARPARHGDEPFFRLVVPPYPAPGSSWLGAWSGPVASSGEPMWDVSADIARVLDRLQPDLVHVVDNVLLPLSIAEVCRDLGIPVVRSVSALEDLCTLVVPVSPFSGPSGICEPPITVEHCVRCIGAVDDDHVLARFRSTGEPCTPRRQELRRLVGAQRARAVHHFSAVYDTVLFASERFRAYFEQTLPLDPSRTRVLPMGVDIVDADAHGAGGGFEPVPGDRPPDAVASMTRPLTFLVAGNAHRAKGTAAIVSAFSHPDVAGRGDWRLLLAGAGDRLLYKPLLDDDRVHDHGPYDPADLAALCARADVGISASVFETFHRVTREYLLRGLPVVGSMAFGVSDVVVDGHNGLLFDHADDGGLRRAVLRLLDDRGLTTRLSVGARATTVRSVSDEVAELMTVYDDLLAVRQAR